MSILHLCNAFFEFELAEQLPPSLESAIASDPIFLQLQFLPLAYANERDKIAVSALPEGFPASRFVLFKHPPKDATLSTWGASLLIKQWADRHGLSYDIPPWDVVKTVNSKAYSFAKSPLPGGRLLHEPETLPPHFVLKSCFGTAGRGMIQAGHPKAHAFCQKEWNQGRPVIAEPWVQRVIDFSTQWEITSQEITLLGTTLLETSAAGQYVGNRVGDAPQEALWAKEIAAHQQFVTPVLRDMQQLGYFGNVGIDAFVYTDEHGTHLQPIVEINARKTMGWVAVQVQKNKAPDKIVTLGYRASQEEGVLPLRLASRAFSRQLLISIQ